MAAVREVVRRRSASAHRPLRCWPNPLRSGVGAPLLGSGPSTQSDSTVSDLLTARATSSVLVAFSSAATPDTAWTRRLLWVDEAGLRGRPREAGPGAGAGRRWIRRFSSQLRCRFVRRSPDQRRCPPGQSHTTRRRGVPHHPPSPQRSSPSTSRFLSSHPFTSHPPSHSAVSAALYSLRLAAQSTALHASAGGCQSSLFSAPVPLLSAAMVELTSHPAFFLGLILAAVSFVCLAVTLVRRRGRCSGGCCHPRTPSQLERPLRAPDEVLDEAPHPPSDEAAV